MLNNEEIRERPIKVILKNKRALRDFFVLSRYEAGIALKGTEVKSLREGKCSVQEAYAAFPDPKKDELYLINMHISPYDQGNIYNHEPKRKRKLLLTKRELRKIRAAIREKGLTLVPLSLYFSGPFVKVELGLVKAKRKYDKREDMKKKDFQRETQRKFKL